MTQAIPIGTNSPIEFDTQYLSQYIVDRELSRLEKVKLKEKFKRQAGTEFEINSIQFEPEIMKVFWIRRPLVEIAVEPIEIPEGTEIPDVQDLSEQLQTIEPQTIIKAKTKLPHIIWYAVSIIAVILAGFLAFRFSLSGVLKLSKEFTAPGRGILNLENIKNLLVPGLLALTLLFIAKGARK